MTEMLNPAELNVDQSTIGLYAELTNDYNPLHVNPEFAAASQFGGIIAHGTMSLNLIWAALTDTLGDAAAEGAILDIRFTKPVRIGDTVCASGKLSADRKYDVWVSNQHGANVIEGTLTLSAGIDR